MKGRPDVGFFEAIKSTQQFSVKAGSIGSQIGGKTSRIVKHLAARFSNPEGLVQDAIASGNEAALPVGSRRADLSGLEKEWNRVEAQEEEIRHLREARCNLNRRITEWRDKYWEAAQELRDAKAVGLFSREVLESHGSPSPEHMDACPWCFLKRRRYPVPPWEMDRLPPPTKEQLDRLLHRTSDGLGCYRWVFLLIFVFLLGWLLWTISPVCLDWYDATKDIIPFVDLMDEIAENAGLALSVLQLPLYTFIPLQISGGLDPFNGLQPSQFAINEARGPIEIALAICQELSETAGTADEEIKNMTKAWDDAHVENWLYFVMLPDHAVARGQETKPQEALRLTNTYITLITEKFMTLSDRHPDNFTMAALSEDSLDILDTVIPIRVDQLHEMINNFRHRKHALMGAMSQIIGPLKACQEYFNRINHTKNAFETKEHIFHANHIADLYKLSRPQKKVFLETWRGSLGGRRWAFSGAKQASPHHTYEGQGIEMVSSRAQTEEYGAGFPDQTGEGRI
ncbi:uncharacterized protein FSUBG_6139 [Fusarium subglutinans]|uniref:Uncharacterized protein n=1 Tax=Gibberella subglutinans TaxID=42677 RepID=A0A8H5Q2B8_GIBSU|nr:uncharacterized protein FSUBG_6139 [Fusarium subglutinans]KAF5606306.1 hypothetical protein FSUBG_6139 [Fusarium subglutinans]